MKIPLHRKKGFTLVEMTVVIVFGLAISSVGMLMLSQQLQTVRRLNQQNFILQESPKINTAMSALLGRADAIRLHQSFADAIQDQNPVLDDANVLVAAFRNIDNNTTFGIINFETDPATGNNRLDYYFFDPADTAPVEGTPSWNISREIADASFALVNGLFQVTLTGPNAEQLTYTISPNQ